MLTRFCSLPLASCVLLVAGPAFAQNAPPAAAPAPAKPPAAAPPAPAAPAPAAPPAPAPELDDEGDVDEAPEPEAPREPATPLPPSLSGLGGATTDAALLAEREKAAPPPRANAETDIYASDWWTHARPIIEIHGYFRMRAELFHHFSLGRVDAPNEALWPRPADNQYTWAAGTGSSTQDTNIVQCTEDEAGSGSGTSTNPNELVGCKNGTQSSANIRLRLNPEIHISDNLRVMTQIDLLDNLVLGSTPRGYANSPDAGGGFMTAPRDAYSPIGFEDDTTSPPRSGINSLNDSVSVKRAWGEYSTPVGEVRFGRMPWHWGLGMVYHSGDGHDDDYQSTIDRLQFVTSIKPLELYISGAWDFPNEGATSANLGIPRDQAYDVAQLDDVDQYVVSVARQKSRELTKLALSRGDVVVNGGVQLTYRKQLLANDLADQDCNQGGATLGCSPGQLTGGFVRRNANYWLPDLWLQILYKQFRFELEVASVQGSIENTTNTRGITDDFDIREWGYAAEIEQRVAEDRLRLNFSTGWASGDADVDGLTPRNGDQHGDDTISTFRFNPSYRVDLILHRNLLSRVQGTYYFRPNLSYDFLREPTGQRLGGGVAAIWSRASQFIQSPGHERDLGIEFDAQLYFQSKDGALNDDPLNMGGFFAKLEYGVLFPMGGLGYPDVKANTIQNTIGRASATEIQTAQIVRLYLGAMF